MLFRASVMAARAAASVSRRLGRGGGTTLPGRLLLGVSPEAIGRLARRLPDGTAVVSATNGKTTTVRIAAAVLEPETRLCANRAGANLASGVASALLHADGARLGLFEVDEAALPAVATALRPSAVALGNLFRDQLDRYGELEITGRRWAEAVGRLGPETALVVNADDPLVGSLGAGRGGALRYGIDDPGVALAALPHASDSKWCPGCGTRLEYRAVYLGHLGDWSCPRGDRARPPLDVSAADVRLEGLDAVSFVLRTAAGEAPVRLPLPGVFNVYNALAAAALTTALGVPLARIAAGLGRVSAAWGRFERVDLGGRGAVLMLMKNPAGANELIRTLGQAAGAPAPVLLALNDRTADGRDVSWIWDVDFERLLPHARSVVCTGTRAAEMALRLKYAGMAAGDVAVEPRLAGAVAALERAVAPGERAHLLATYTAMLDLRALLADRGLVRPYWEATA